MPKKSEGKKEGKVKVKRLWGVLDSDGELLGPFSTLKEAREGALKIAKEEIEYEQYPSAYINVRVICIFEEAKVTLPAAPNYTYALVPPSGEEE